MRETTYHQLVQVLEGDEEARGALLTRLRPRLVLWASTRMSADLRARLTAEDVAQEVLLALHKSLNDVRGVGATAFRGWVFTVAENRMRDLGRAANARKRRTPDPEPQSQTSPSGNAMREEMALRVREAVERLPEDYRRVIQLRRIEEREPDEVARAMERSPGAIRLLYFRAIQALRVEMDSGV